MYISNGFEEERTRAARQRGTSVRTTRAPWREAFRNGNEIRSSRCSIYHAINPPTLLTLFEARKEETSRSDTRLEQTCRCVIFFFFRLLIVLFIIIIITHQSVENERLKKKKGKARDELTPLVTPYQCTVAHVRENTWTWPPLRGCRCGSVCVWTKWREWMRVRCCWRARAVDYHCCKLHTRSLAVRNRKRMLFLFFQSRFFNLRQLHLILKVTRTNLYRKISISNIFRREWKLFVKESCSFLPRRIFFS